MSFGFLASGIVKGKIKDRLRKDGPGLFDDQELELAANKFEAAGTKDDLNDLKDESKQKAKAIEIFRRVVPKTDIEKAVVAKIDKLYSNLA